jgi:hypothetical protein
MIWWVLISQIDMVTGLPNTLFQPGYLGYWEISIYQTWAFHAPDKFWLRKLNYKSIITWIFEGHPEGVHNQNIQKSLQWQLIHIFENFAHEPSINKPFKIPSYTTLMMIYSHNLHEMFCPNFAFVVIYVPNYNSE